MEEIKHKIANGRPSTVAGAVAKLHDTILKEGKTGKESQEVEYLWTSLNSDKASLESLDALLSLVQLGRIDLNPTLSNLLVGAQGRSVHGLVNAVGRFIRIKIVQDPNLHYGIAANSHPIISLLRASPTSVWQQIPAYVQTVLADENLEMETKLRLVQPLVLYIMCDPHHHDHLASLRSMTAKILIKNKFLVDEVLEWTKLDNPNVVAEHLDFVLEAITLTDLNYLPLLASSCITAAKHGVPFSHLLERIKSRASEASIHVSNVCVYLLSELLESSSVIFLDEICRCVQALSPSKLALAVFMGPLLQFVSHPSKYVADKWSNSAPKIIVKFLSDEQAGESDPDENIYGQWDPKIRNSLRMLTLLHSKQDFFQQLSSMQIDASLVDLFPVFSAILLTANSHPITGQVLDLLVKTVHQNSEFATQVLTLIMYKLSSTRSESSLYSDPAVYKSLLEALPPLAVDKCCVSLVLQIIQSLGAKPGLVVMKIRLLYDLWLTEDRCYPYLQRALEQPSNDPGVSLTKAQVIVEICGRNPGKHGADLLRLLSDLLNVCYAAESGVDVSTAVLALKGIVILCQEGIIDISTTVKVLSPKLRRAQSPEVTVEYLELLSIGPTFEMNGAEYVAFLNESLEYLWQIVDTNQCSKIRQAAMRAISFYDLEHHTLKMMPKFCKENLKLPSSYCSTPEEAERKPEDVLDYIPGSVWLNLIQQNEDRPSAQALVTKVIVKELRALPRSAFALPQAMKSKDLEPQNYNQLHDRSILKAVIQKVQSSQSLETKDVEETLSLLVIKERLPPLDWSFLRPISRSKIVASIVALQAQHSTSSRLLLESILSESGSATRADTFFPFIHHIVGSCQSGDEYVQKSLELWASSALRDASAGQTFKSILNACAELLQTPDLPSLSRDTICNGLERLSPLLTSASSDLVDAYLDAVAEMPVSKLDKFSSASNHYEVKTKDTIVYCNSF